MCIICVIFKSLSNLLVPLPNQFKNLSTQMLTSIRRVHSFLKAFLKRKRFDEVRYVEVCDCCFYRDEILRVELSHAAATNLVLS